MIEGKYGQLTINPATGDYTYTSSGDSASVGQLDEFEYTVVHEGNEPVTNRIVILQRAHPAQMLQLTQKIHV